MTTTSKNYSTLELISYRLSNRAKLVYFETKEEAIEFAKEQRKLHPRSKKLNGTVTFNNPNGINETYYC